MGQNFFLECVLHIKIYMSLYIDGIQGARAIADFFFQMIMLMLGSDYIDLKKKICNSPRTLYIDGIQAILQINFV